MFFFKYERHGKPSLTPISSDDSASQVTEGKCLSSSLALIALCGALETGGDGGQSYRQPSPGGSREDPWKGVETPVG